MHIFRNSAETRGGRRRWLWRWHPVLSVSGRAGGWNMSTTRGRAARGWTDGRPTGRPTRAVEPSLLSRHSTHAARQHTCCARDSVMNWVVRGLPARRHVPDAVSHIHKTSGIPWSFTGNISCNTQRSLESMLTGRLASLLLTCSIQTVYYEQKLWFLNSVLRYVTYMLFANIWSEILAIHNSFCRAMLCSAR